MSFMDRVRRATTDPGPRAIFQCSEVWDAGEAQDSLRTMAILRGHHYKDLYYAIKQTYQPRNKPPLELCATLVREVWRFFEKIWENRNNCLHNPSGEPLSP